MILASVIHTDNGDTPNTGNNLHLTNQVGQEDFKLGGGIFLRNTDATEFKATLNIKQALLGESDDKEVASITKDVPVTVPAGKGIDLSPMASGSIPMKTVSTLGTRYRYRLMIKNGDAVISDTVTGVAFDQTNTVFTSESAPLLAPVDTNQTAKKELVVAGAALKAASALIATKQDEIKILQPRIAKLEALLA